MAHITTWLRSDFIGKLVADVGGMIGGMILTFLGMGGNVGGLTFAPVTGGASLSVTAASTALALEGVAIPVSAAGDISVSAEKIAAEISKFPSSSDSNDDSDDEKESDIKAEDVNWKGFSGKKDPETGLSKLQSHYQKHVVEGKEFGNIS